MTTARDLRRWLHDLPGDTVIVFSLGAERLTVNESWPNPGNGEYRIDLSQGESPETVGDEALTKYAVRMHRCRVDAKYARRQGETYPLDSAERALWLDTAREAEELYERGLAVLCSKLHSVPLIRDVSGNVMRLSDANPLRDLTEDFIERCQQDLGRSMLPPTDR